MIPVRVAVVVSANFEWKVCYELMGSGIPAQKSPYGEWFTKEIDTNNGKINTGFLHGGWGKIDAAGSAQYIIDVWKPELIINIGTCGGFEGEIERGTIVMAEKTIVYDIYEQMLDPQVAIDAYTTPLDLSWLREPYPHPVLRTLLVSADRDLIAGEVSELNKRFGAVAGDWESGAIAHVASRNKTRCLILRGVSDLVGENGGEAYIDDAQAFLKGTQAVFEQLFGALPHWIEQAL